jgi:hypothetical protein
MQVDDECLLIVFSRTGHSPSRTKSLHMFTTVMYLSTAPQRLQRRMISYRVNGEGHMEWDLDASPRDPDFPCSLIYR